MRRVNIFIYIYGKGRKRATWGNAKVYLHR